MKPIVITGQTATGKTKLAFKYAIKYNGELVNFDSRQIYKHLDIITGKDLSNNSEFRIQNLELKIKNKKFNIGYYQISTNLNKSQSFLTNSNNSTSCQPLNTIHQPPATKIWLYDIINPDQYFSSFEYIKIAQKVIKNIIFRGKTPILVGGSYFYLKHLLYGFDFAVPPNFKLREKLNKKSVQELQNILNNLQGQSLLGTVLKRYVPPRNQSDWQNPRRLIRKIEIEKFRKLKSYKAYDHAFGGVKLSSDKKIEYPSFKIIGLKYKNKQDLIVVIKSRVEKRLKQGAINEVKNILKMGYKKNDPGLKTIGYKQIIEYLEGKINLQKAIENWITAEVQYAKRQYTFMKKDRNIKWNLI